MFIRDSRNDTGSALLELALVVPIFVLLFTGAAEFGRLAYAAIEVTNAARAGAAYGVQNHATASDVTGMTVAATSDGPNVAPITVWAGPCICPSSSATSSVPACSGTTAFTSNISTTTNPVSYSFACPSDITSATEFVQVNTTASVSTFLHYPGLPSSYTVNGSATMVVEQ
jgi:Flp pilus assembly protein TadG